MSVTKLHWWLSEVMKTERRIHARNQLGERCACCSWELAVNWKATWKNHKEFGKIAIGINM